MITMTGEIALPGLQKPLTNPTRGLLLRLDENTDSGEPQYLGMVLEVLGTQMIEPGTEFRPATARFWNEEDARRCLVPNREWPVWAGRILGVMRGTTIEDR